VTSCEFGGIGDSLYPHSERAGAIRDDLPEKRMPKHNVGALSFTCHDFRHDYTPGLVVGVFGKDPSLMRESSRKCHIYGRWETYSRETFNKGRHDP
jgi:hypothetical protein